MQFKYFYKLPNLTESKHYSRPNWVILLQIPIGCKELHHEIELGVVIGSNISRADPKKAFASVGGYALVLDMTARDLQV